MNKELTTQQEKILEEYTDIASELRDKADNAIYEARELKEWADNIDNFVYETKRGSTDQFQNIENLSRKPTDICHLDLFMENIPGSMSEKSDLALGDEFSRLENEVEQAWPYEEDEQEC